MSMRRVLETSNKPRCLCALSINLLCNEVNMVREIVLGYPREIITLRKASTTKNGFQKIWKPLCIANRPHRSCVNQRLENCGARRALCRPAFLRSTTRASRVKKPCFLRVARLLSRSIALRARATPRRIAPA